MTEKKKLTEIYDAAYRFIDAAIWKEFYDDEIFGVLTESGGTVFCSVLGHNGECFALNMYLGKTGWNSYLRLHYDALSIAEQQEFLFHQVCLQVAYDEIEDIHPGSFEQLKDYAKAREMPLDGPRYANFVKYEKLKMPWPIRNDSDFKIVKECLDAALHVAELRKSGELKMERFYEYHQVPVFKKEKDSYTKRWVAVASKHDWNFKAPLSKEYSLVKNSSKRGTLYCDLVFLPMPIQGKGRAASGAPAFPLGLMAITDKDVFLQMEPLLCYEKEPGKFIDVLATGMTQNKYFPKKIVVRNERTFKLLYGFCLLNGIDLDLGELKYIDDAYMFLLEQMGR